MRGRKSIYFRGRIETLENQIGFYTAYDRLVEANAIRQLARKLNVQLDEVAIKFAAQIHLENIKNGS